MLFGEVHGERESQRPRELNPTNGAHCSASKTLIQRDFCWIRESLNPSRSINIRRLVRRRATYAQHGLTSTCDSRPLA